LYTKVYVHDENLPNLPSERPNAQPHLPHLCCVQPGIMRAAAALAAAAICGLAATAEARKGEKGRTPILGWNTWCTEDSCGVDWCTSAEILDVATTIKSSGLQAIGYDHINLDDCWGERDKTTHQIIGDPLRFPEGMPAFIAKLHAMDFKFGLYTDIGPEGCHNPFTGSYGYYAQDAATFKEWEVDYVKFDGCDQPAGHTSQELTCNMSQALLDTGRDFWFNFHCWHNEACAECGTSFRVGPDHHDNWASTAGIIELLAKKRQPFWGADPTYGWPDPDFIYTGGQVTSFCADSVLILIWENVT
jgi:alpha-galactosidase